MHTRLPHISPALRRDAHTSLPHIARLAQRCTPICLAVSLTRAPPPRVDLSVPTHADLVEQWTLQEQIVSVARRSKEMARAKETAIRQLGQLTDQLDQARQASKAERARLVAFTLESLRSLRTHLVATLTGGLTRAPLIQPAINPLLSMRGLTPATPAEKSLLRPSVSLPALARGTANTMQRAALTQGAFNVPSMNVEQLVTQRARAMLAAQQSPTSHPAGGIRPPKASNGVQDAMGAGGGTGGADAGHISSQTQLESNIVSRYVYEQIMMDDDVYEAAEPRSAAPRALHGHGIPNRKTASRTRVLAH